ncbi:MAG: hypothetical protein WHS89_14730, partial [Acidimicrobiales bacterium]
PVALVEFAERGAADGDRALAPYWRLRTLGTDGRGGLGDYEIANTELDAWIARGTLPNDPSRSPAQPVGADGESPAERKQACLATLDGWRARYGELVNRPIEVKRFFSVPRITELATDLMAAFEDLERGIARIDTDEARGEW